MKCFIPGPKTLQVLLQAEASAGVSYSEPLRRYANSVATDMKLSYRATLTNGDLKAGPPVNSNPQVFPTGPQPSC